MKKILYLLPLSLFFFQCGGVKKAVDTGKDAVEKVTTFRSNAPEPAAAPKIQLGDYETFTLDNGLQVVVVENHKIPRVSFQLQVDNDPVQEGEYAGYASMAGQMLTKGTTTRTKAQLDEEIDFIGARLSTSDGGLFAASLTKHVPKLLELMSDVVLNPAFPEDELEKMKKQQISALASDKDDPNSIARNVANVLRFGKNHPYGEIETEASIEKISLAKCREYYETYFRPNVSYLAVVGDITAAEAKTMLEKSLGAWQKKDVPTYTYDTPTQPDDTKVAFVNKDGAVQSVISVTYPVDLKPGAPDAIKASVMNSILGGGVFSGRLMQNLREDKAYTYGARSSLRTDKLAGTFSAGASVRNEVTDSSVVQFMYELNRMRDEIADQKDLDLVLNSRTGSFARSLERPETMARFALNTIRYDLPKDYYATYLEKLNAVTLADVQAMAKKYIKPDNAYIVIVGNQEEVAGKLGQFAASGKVDFYDKEGNPAKVIDVPTDVTPQSIIDKYIEVTGGKAAWEAMKDYKVVMAGEMQGLPLKMTTTGKAPNSFKLEVSAMGQVMQSQVYDGAKAKSTMMGTTTMLEGDELAAMKYQGMLNKELMYDELGYTLKLSGIDKVNGEEAYKISVTNPLGNTSTEYYSKATGFKIQETSTAEMQGRMITSITTYGDYKEVDGIKMPHSMSIKTGSQPAIPLKVSSYETNVGLTADDFKVE